MTVLCIYLYNVTSSDIYECLNIMKYNYRPFVSDEELSKIY